jgi:HEAT repeat protein
LVNDALDAQRLEEVDSEAKNTALELLIDHPSEEVFRHAVSLCASQHSGERKLGVRILRELGRPRMPYAVGATKILREVILESPDTDLLVWEVSALGNQHEPSALPVLWELANHSESPVRDAVCGAISGAAQRIGLDEHSVHVLVQLSHDNDANVRFSAVFELAAWRAEGVSNATLLSALERATLDPDPQISAMAVNGLQGRV